MFKYIYALAVSMSLILSISAQEKAIVKPTSPFVLTQAQQKEAVDRYNAAITSQSRFQDAQQFYNNLVSKETYNQILALTQKEMELKVEQYNHFIDSLRYSLSVPKDFLFNIETKEFGPPLPAK